MLTSLDQRQGENNASLLTKSNFTILLQCAVPEKIHTPPSEEIGISWEVGGSVRSKNLKKCMKLNWNFQRDEVVLEKIPSVGEVWIFSEITQYISGTKNEV